MAGAVLAAACGGGEVTFETSAARGDGALVVDVTEPPSVSGGLLPASSGQAADHTPAGPGNETRPGSPTATPGAVDDADVVVGPDRSAPGDAEPIRLGTILPLQGGERDFGEPVLRTTQAFIDEINSRGGVLGRRLELVAYHACLLCQGDALTAARRLVEQDRVFALVNTYVMVVAFQPVIPYLVEQNVPLIQGGSFAQTSDALSPINFATAPTGLFYGRWIAVTAAKVAGISRAGLVYLDVPSATNGLPLLRRELAAQGVEVVAEASVEAAEEAVTNMDSIVTRFRAAGADGVVGLDPAVLIFGRLAARRQSWDVSWVGPAAWGELVETGCGRTCDETVFTETGGLSFIDRDTPQMAQFHDTLDRRYPGAQRTGHTLAAWVGMQLLVEGLSRSGRADATSFLAAVESIRNLDLGTTSPLTFSPDRHLGGTQTVLLNVQDGRFVRLKDAHSYGEADP